MATYTITLNDRQEKFLDLYLVLFELREGDNREDYPGLIANNFINSMMKRTPEFLSRYKAKFGKEFCHDSILD